LKDLRDFSRPGAPSRETAFLGQALIKILKVDRMDLIAAYPRRILAIDYGAGEIADAYPEQQARYRGAIIAQHLETWSVVDSDESVLFARLDPG
jgi:hypothetical protein